MTPILAGLLSVVIRTAPYTDTSTVHEAVQEGLEKELRASINSYHPVELDYDAIFQRSTAKRQVALAPNLRRNQLAQDDIHMKLQGTKRKLSNRVFYPRYSKKKTSRTSRENIDSAYGGVNKDIEEAYCTLDAEKIYHRTGFRFRGYTEVGQAFKYTDLRPRTFFRLGLDQYYDARPIQAIANILVDAFENTHTKARFNSIPIRLEKHMTAFIYDYSAFTSTLEEIRSFCSALANFYRGTMVTIIDTFHGPQQHDLGDILDRYNAACNDQDFDAGEAMKLATDMVLHHTAGMLGVPGNISLSTLLHGLHLAIVLNGILSCKVVGDDAVGVFGELGKEARMNLQSMLQNLGIFALSKMAFWGPETRERESDCAGWNYVKRPFNRLGDRMSLGNLITWPALENILELVDRLHTTLPVTPFLRKKKYANQVIRFLGDIESLPSRPSDFELSIIRWYLKQGHKAVGLSRSGADNALSEYSIRCPPAEYEEDWYTEYMLAHGSAVTLVPRRWDNNLLEPGDFEPSMTSSFADRSRPVWKLAEDLGYVQRKALQDKVVVDEFPFMKQILCKDKTYVPLYEFQVIQEMPYWMKNLALAIPTCLPSDPISIVTNEYEGLDTLWDVRSMSSDSDSSDN